MENLHPLTIELGERDWTDLCALARYEGVSPSHLLRRALDRDLRDHRAHVARIEIGLADLAAGRSVTHEEMIAIRAEQRQRFLDTRQAAE